MTSQSTIPCPGRPDPPLASLGRAGLLFPPCADPPAQALCLLASLPPLSFCWSCCPLSHIFSLHSIHNCFAGLSLYLVVPVALHRVAHLMLVSTQHTVCGSQGRTSQRPTWKAKLLHPGIVQIPRQSLDAWLPLGHHGFQWTVTEH